MSERRQQLRTPTLMDLPERLRDRAAIYFWARVTKSDGCWLWAGSLGAHGYGVATTCRRIMVAHRVSWELNQGKIPAGLIVCHRCDNPPCVNPDHLFLGTHQDNTLDMVAKGRHGRTRFPSPRGADHPLSRLSHHQRAEVLSRRQSGETFASLARRYGVSATAIRGYVTRGFTPQSSQTRMGDN